MNSLNKYVLSPGARWLEHRHLAQLFAFFITSAALVCMFYGKIIKLWQMCTSSNGGSCEIAPPPSQALTSPEHFNAFNTLSDICSCGWKSQFIWLYKVLNLKLFTAFFGGVYSLFILSCVITIFLVSAQQLRMWRIFCRLAKTKVWCHTRGCLPFVIPSSPSPAASLIFFFARTCTDLHLQKPTERRRTKFLPKCTADEAAMNK